MYKPVWLKLFSLVMAILAGLLLWWFFSIMIGQLTPFDRFFAGVETHVIPMDWAVSYVGGIFLVLSLVYTKQVPQRWIIAVLNVVNLAIWWGVERGVFGDLTLMSIALTITMIPNIIYALCYTYLDEPAETQSVHTDSSSRLNSVHAGQAGMN